MKISTQYHKQIFMKISLHFILLLLFTSNNLIAQVKPSDAVAPIKSLNTPLPPYQSNIKVNYIRTWDAMAPFTNPTSSQLADTALFRQATAYFDGLGQPLQEVIKAGSPEGEKDIISMHVYDEFGREIIQYLPFPASVSENMGKFKLNPFQLQQNFYNHTAGSNFHTSTEKDQRPFAVAAFEPVPVSRPLKSMAPGNNWVGNEIGVSVSHSFNAAADSVRIWSIGYQSIADANNRPTSASGAVYSRGQLNKTITNDEHGKKVIEFADKNGQVILKKVQISDSPSGGHSGWLCTYYIYDDYGNLRFVIPPKAVEAIISNWSVTTEIATQLCFRYEYDYRRRMIAKQVPGAGWVEMAYDKRDRLVYSRDANQKAQNKWMVTFYDSFNRDTSRALMNSSSTRPTLQTQLNGLTATNPVPVITEANLYRLSYTVYDTYGKSWMASYNAGQVAASKTGFDMGDEFPDETTGLASTTKGLVTGTRSRILTSTGENWINTTTFYDQKLRPVQVISINHKAGTDIVSTQYSFTGKPVSTVSVHQNPGAALAGTQQITTHINSVYQNGYLKIVKQKMNSGEWKVLSDLEYDDMGKLAKKKMGNGYIQNNQTKSFYTNSSYNIRGWLTGLNKEEMIQSGTSSWNSSLFWEGIFGQILSYDYGFNKIENGNTPAYSLLNGNISGQIWMHAGNTRKRSFGYEYDNANRLLKADYAEQYYGWRTNKDSWYEYDFTVNNLQYDANGNILRMNQRGVHPASYGSLIDSLVYGYSTLSNKLLNVTDHATDTTVRLGDFWDGNKGSLNDYAYDANGNLTMDRNKGIDSIYYNFLNLPSKISFAGKGTVEYLYDAAGIKYQKKVTEGARITTTDYIMGAEYRNDTLTQLMHAEGRVRYAKRYWMNGDSALRFEYDYFYKDHLGNVRATVTEQKDSSRYNVTTELAQEARELQYTWYSTADTRTISQLTGYTGSKDTGNRVLRTITHDKRYVGYNTVLKVMAGDEIELKVDYYYRSNDIATDTVPITGWNYYGWIGFLNQLFGQEATGVGNHYSPAQVGGGGTSINAWSLSQFLTQRNTDAAADPNYNSRPKAFLNWMFMDENFKITEHGNGWRQVGNANTDFASLVSSIPVSVTKSGYLYVWVSNESKTPVYFDELVINHRTGPLVSEDDYYPFGLTMAGISSKAAGKLENKNRFSSKELQSQEFSDFSGLDIYDFHARQHDPQIGRFLQIDPMADSYFKLTPYNYVANNPLNGIDPDGKDIIFLNDTKGANDLGHASVIIGNSKDGWFYYSLNGTGEGQSPYGDAKNSDIGTFLGHGTDIVQLIKDANTVNPKENHDYNRYVAVKTTPEEDQAMKKKAEKAASVKKYYIIYGHSCIDVAKSCYDQLANMRVGFMHNYVDQITRNDVTPNFWFDNLPGTFKNLNTFMSRWGIGNDNYFKKPRKAIIEVAPLGEGEYGE